MITLVIPLDLSCKGNMITTRYSFAGEASVEVFRCVWLKQAHNRCSSVGRIKDPNVI
jgi:hypothetical protein